MALALTLRGPGTGIRGDDLPGFYRAGADRCRDERDDETPGSCRTFPLDRDSS